MNATQMQDRRENVRLGAAAAIDARVLDGHDQPVTDVCGARLLNLSAGGLAFTSLTPAEAGSRLQLSTSESPASGGVQAVRVEVVECVPRPDGRYLLRCRLIEGRVPAAWIGSW